MQLQKSFKKLRVITIFLIYISHGKHCVFQLLFGSQCVNVNQIIRKYFEFFQNARQILSQISFSQSIFGPIYQRINNGFFLHSHFPFSLSGIQNWLSSIKMSIAVNEQIRSVLVS